MRARYLLATGDRQALDQIGEECRKRDPLFDIRRFALPWTSVLIASQAGTAQPFADKGVLVGPLFKRGSNAALTLDEKQGAEAVESCGSMLVQRYWGGYVTIIIDPAQGCIHVVRAPLGDLPCYWTQAGKGLLASSDLGLLRVAGMAPPAIDPAALARQLAAEDLRRPETCLDCVRELPGGNRMSVGSGEVRQEPLWSPWSFASPDNQIEEPEEQRRRVRDAALHCVAARASLNGHLLLKLSGGLDSSIVAACLHSAPHPFTALNLVTRDPSGDERSYARAVAQSLGVGLIERFRETSGVCLGNSAAARLPRPTSRSFTQESTRIAQQAASECGATAVFDGGGGDNIFCSLQSARVVADCLLDPNGAGRFWNTAGAVAEVAQASVLRVASRAFLVSRRRSPGYRWEVDLRFLSVDARSAAEHAVHHPWLLAPPGALPGKAAHVGLIVGAQSVAEGFDADDQLATYSPLIAQPLVEACLKVPSWAWFGKGLNRAVARSAFAGMLPQTIVRRRSKGAPDCFIAAVYEEQRSLLRSMLLDGLLRQMQLLDVSALSAALDSHSPVEGHDYLRIMQLADAEAWVRAWS